MKALRQMVGKEVVLESVYHREISGILSSAEELGVSIDKEIFVPIRSVFRISLKDRFEGDKKKEMEKTKSNVSFNVGRGFGS